MKNILSAEELLLKSNLSFDDFTEIEEVMINFATLHVEAALKKAAEEAVMTIDIDSGYVGNSTEYSKKIDYHLNCGESRYYSDNTAYVNKDSILNAYPKELIK